MTDDEGVSELMGYTVLVAVVSIASAALLAGSMGMLSASEKSLECKGSVESLRSFANIIGGVVEANNTYDTAFEMSVPSGCDLNVRDKHDDFRSLSIYLDSTPLAFLPMGGVSVTSPFRTAYFEGGMVASNDTGIVKPVLSPAVRVAALPSGKKALYLSVTSISSPSFIKHAGPVTLFARCNYTKAMTWHIPAGSVAFIYVRSGEPSAWKEAFEECGLGVTYDNGAVKASSPEVSDIYVTYSEAVIHE